MKLLYGIAVASAKQLAELPELKKAAFLELPSALPDSGDIKIPAAWKKRFFRVSGRNEARALASLIDARKNMQIDFLRVFGTCCDMFSRLGVREISLSIDWDAALSNSAYVGRLREILHSCFGITEKYHLSLVTEVRIPGSIIRGDEFYRFRNFLMIPVRTLVNLHPHEPGALDLLEKFSAAMPFECDKLRLSFDAADGNYLTERLLERIRKSIRRAGALPPEICFYPGRNADKTAFAALDMVMA